MHKRPHNDKRRKGKKVKTAKAAAGAMPRKETVRGNEFLSTQAICIVTTRSTKADAVNRLKRAGILTKSGSLAGRYK